MNTYNQIIQKLESFSQRHLLLRSFGYGTAAMLNSFTNNNLELPLLYAQIESIVSRTNTIDYNFKLKVLDTRSKDNDNLRDLQSDIAQIMVDLKQWLTFSFDCEEIWLEHGTVSNIIPLVNVTQDWLSGWEMNLAISTSQVDSVCLVPIEGCDTYVPGGYVSEGYTLCGCNGELDPWGYDDPLYGTHLDLRKGQTGPLRHSQVDGNFEYLDNKAATPGPTGATGVGATGPKGNAGTKGATGPKGVDGIIGVDGDTGPQGIQGNVGPTGAKGSQGNAGIKGDTGSQGPIGNAGTKGYTGSQGPIGNAGVKGDTGSQGPIGNAGVKGDTGPQGIQGNVGPEGPSDKKITARRTLIPLADLPSVSSVTVKDWLNSNESIGDNEVLFWEITGEITNDAVGGIITEITEGDDTYKVHTFIADDDFIVEGSLNVEYLVVAGGGGGGASTNTLAGGAGGGGMVEGSKSVSADTYSIIVGSGGAGGYGTDQTSPDSPRKGTNGSDSTALGFTAVGGGAGAGGTYNSPSRDGNDGGSGGGGCDSRGGLFGNGLQSDTSNPGATINVGNDGGTWAGNGAGGGGAGGNTTDGFGGAGLSSSITGTAVLYAGGGAATPAPSGTAPTGSTLTNDAGVDGTGAGGGGGTSSLGRDGGSGIVIIRYKRADSYYMKGVVVNKTKSVFSVSPLTDDNIMVF